MVWVTPISKSAGNTGLSADWNTYVQGNTNALRDYMLGAQDLGSNWNISSGRFLLFKDTDVVHGMTTVVGVASFFDTNTWFGIGQRSGTAGGVYLFGASDTDSIGNTIWGINGSAAGVTAPGLQLGGSKKSGAATTSFSVTEEVLRFNNDTTTLGQWWGNGLSIAGGLFVGTSVSVPTAGQISIGDNNFNMVLSAGVAYIYFDLAVNARFQYTRSSDIWAFVPNNSGAVISTIEPNGISSGGSLGLAGITPFSTVGCIDVPKGADVANPAAGNARFFVKDNGAGKGQACVRFASGVTQVYATEP